MLPAGGKARAEDQRDPSSSRRVLWGSWPRVDQRVPGLADGGSGRRPPRSPPRRRPATAPCRGAAGAAGRLGRLDTGGEECLDEARRDSGASRAPIRRWARRGAPRREPSLPGCRAAGEPRVQVRWLTCMMLAASASVGRLLRGRLGLDQQAGVFDLEPGCSLQNRKVLPSESDRRTCLRYQNYMTVTSSPTIHHRKIAADTLATPECSPRRPTIRKSLTSRSRSAWTWLFLCRALARCDAPEIPRDSRPAP